MDTPAIYHDLNGFSQLRAQARRGDGAASKEVARQFESVFIKTMLKAMRDTIPEGGLFDSSQMQMYQQMFDQQISLDLSRGKGFGLANIIERQLGGNNLDSETPDASGSDGSGVDKSAADESASEQSASANNTWINSIAERFGLGRPSSDPATGVGFTASKRATTDSTTTGSTTTGSTTTGSTTTVPTTVDSTDKPFVPMAAQSAREEQVDSYWKPAGVDDFIEHIRAYATKAAADLGISPNVLIAQTALETGWGQKVVRHGDGQNSFNLFGIKADAAWQGDKAARVTLEYNDGVAEKELAQFRAYGSIGGAFEDYVSFLRGNPRYMDALAKRGSDEHFVRGLQEAGYATDPEYADKILAIQQQLDGVPGNREPVTQALKNSANVSLL